MRQADRPQNTLQGTSPCRNSDGSVTVNTRRIQFRSNRATNIERFASNALNLLRLTILEG